MSSVARTVIGVGLATGVCLFGVSFTLWAQEATPAVYTAAQAAEGATLYASSCSVCHGANLMNGSAPALAGEAFARAARAQKLTVSALYQVTARTMPKGAPGTLTEAQNTAIIAYILQANGYPAGRDRFTPSSQLALARPEPAGSDHGVAQSAQSTAVAGEAVVTQAAPVSANVHVTDAQLHNADKDLDNWLLYGRTYDNQRFSPLKQINDKNVRRLVPVSIIQTGISNSFEASPIVVNGVMYISTPFDHVMAFDAATGEVLWTYVPKLGYSRQCCGPVSRGVAVAYGKVYIAQLDGVVAALDATNGKVLWKTDPVKTLPGPDITFYSFTLAPQVYNGLVLVGSAGAEWPTRGFVQAYDAQTGAVRWRFNTIPGPGEPGNETWAGDSWKYGGGSVWTTPAVDVARNHILFGTGNPNPDNAGDVRNGDNAYTDSIVSIDAGTGKLNWWHQIVAHDEWDYDQCAPVVFFDADDGTGRKVPAVGEAGKQGELVIVNRETGKLIRRSQPFVFQSSTMYSKNGSDTINRAIYPSAAGGNTWSPGAFSPVTHNYYVTGANMAWAYTADDDAKIYEPGEQITGQYNEGRMKILSDVDTSGNVFKSSGTFSAIDVNTGKISWQYKSELPMIGGAMATAGNLVFTGEQNGWFNAFDAKSGKKLWRFYLGVGVTAPPISYRVKGVQYIAVAAGGVSANGYQTLLQKRGRPIFGNVIAIFALPRS